MIQDVVPFLAGGYLDELSQKERCTLGNGEQFVVFFRLPIRGVDLCDKIQEKQNKLTENFLNFCFYDGLGDMYTALLRQGQHCSWQICHGCKDMTCVLDMARPFYQ